MCSNTRCLRGEVTQGRKRRGVEGMMLKRDDSGAVDIRDTRLVSSEPCTDGDSIL